MDYNGLLEEADSILLEGAMDHLAAGQVAKAERLLRTTAETCPEAAYELGRLLWDKGDKTEAVQWTRSAADRGVLEAIYSLGMRLLIGDGAIQDVPAATARFREASARDYPQAQYQLATLLLEDDPAEAARLFRKAADQQVPEAACNYGTMLLEGVGVPPDAAGAAVQFRRAAELGLNSAKINLAYLFTMGRGVPEDKREAETWVRAAEEGGMENARETLAAMVA